MKSKLNRLSTVVVPRLVRLLDFRGLPRGNKQYHLRQNHKMYEKLRKLADFLGGIGIILCLGMVYMTGVGFNVLWGKAKEIISPPEKMEHQQYHENLDNSQDARQINHPRIRGRANNSGNSYHDPSPSTGEKGKQL